MQRNSTMTRSERFDSYGTLKDVLNPATSRISHPTSPMLAAHDAYRSLMDNPLVHTALETMKSSSDGCWEQVCHCVHVSTSITLPDSAHDPARFGIGTRSSNIYDCRADDMASMSDAERTILYQLLDSAIRYETPDYYRPDENGFVEFVSAYVIVHSVMRRLATCLKQSIGLSGDALLDYLGEPGEGRRRGGIWLV